MARIERSVIIQQPLERVFTFVSDQRNNALWQPDLVEVRVTPDGPPQVGTQAVSVRQLRNYTGEVLEAVIEMTEVEQNKSFRIQSLSGLATFQAQMLFDDTGDGIKVTFVVNVEGPDQMISALAKDIEMSFVILKELLEQPQPRHILPGQGEKYMIVKSDIVTFKIVGSDKDTQGGLFMAEMLVPPQGGPDLHKHAYEESFYVLEGELEFARKKPFSTLRVGPGSIIHIPSYAPHGFKNIGTKPAKLLMMFTPAGVEDFFRVVGTAIEDGTTVSNHHMLDHTQSQAILEKYHIEILAP